MRQWRKGQVILFVEFFLFLLNKKQQQQQQKWKTFEIKEEEAELLNLAVEAEVKQECWKLMEQ